MITSKHEPKLGDLVLYHRKIYKVSDLEWNASEYGFDILTHIQIERSIPGGGWEAIPFTVQEFRRYVKPV
jgi:hypothetical protein